MPIGFSVRYRAVEKIHRLIFVGHLWNRRLEIYHLSRSNLIEVISPQIEISIVKLVSYFRDYYFEPEILDFK